MAISDDDLMNKPYAAFANATWWVIASRGNIGFRFGPFAPAAIGQIVERANREKIPVSVSAICEGEFDWELAADLRGSPLNKQAADLLRTMLDNDGECIADHPEWVASILHILKAEAEG